MPIPMNVDRLVGVITALIERGGEGWRPGDQLPKYRELADVYQTSVPTVARAIRKLRDAGLVVGVPGRGTYVAEELQQ